MPSPLQTRSAVLGIAVLLCAVGAGAQTVINSNIVNVNAPPTVISRIGKTAAGPVSTTVKFVAYNVPTLDSIQFHGTGYFIDPLGVRRCPILRGTSCGVEINGGGTCSITQRTETTMFVGNGNLAATNFAGGPSGPLSVPLIAPVVSAPINYGASHKTNTEVDSAYWAHALPGINLVGTVPNPNLVLCELDVVLHANFTGTQVSAVFAATGAVLSSQIAVFPVDTVT